MVIIGLREWTLGESDCSYRTVLLMIAGGNNYSAEVKRGRPDHVGGGHTTGPKVK